MSQITEEFINDAQNAVEGIGAILNERPNMARLLSQFLEVFRHELDPYYEEITSGKSIQAIQEDVSCYEFLVATLEIIERVKE